MYIVCVSVKVSFRCVTPCFDFNPRNRNIAHTLLAGKSMQRELSEENRPSNKRWHFYEGSFARPQNFNDIFRKPGLMGHVNLIVYPREPADVVCNAPNPDYIKRLSNFIQLF